MATVVAPAPAPAAAPAAALTRAPVTLDAFYQMADLPDGAELVRGKVVVTPPPASDHSYLSAALFVAMHAHATAHRLGRCFVDGTGYELPVPGRPDVYRIPDASFVRAERIPRPRVRHRALAVAPDVAAEVLSPSDIYSVISAKVRDYLEAGTAVVWLVDPDARTVEVRARDVPPRELREGDTLEGGDAFPGFSLPLAQLFAALDD